MYLIGENSINYPWYMPKDFPSDSLAEVPKDRFLYFVKKEQWTMDWSTLQRQTYYLFRVLFPYAAEYIHRSTRRRHFRDVSTQLYTTFDHSFWEDTTQRTVRLSCDQ